MKNVDMLLSRFDAMSDDEVIALLKEALDVSEIPYIPGPGPIDLFSLIPDLSDNSDSFNIRLKRSERVKNKYAYQADLLAPDYKLECSFSADKHPIMVKKDFSFILDAA